MGHKLDIKFILKINLRAEPMSVQFTSLEESRLGSLSDREVQIPACQDTVTGYRLPADRYRFLTDTGIHIIVLWYLGGRC